MEIGNLEQITSTINSAVSNPVACNAEIVGNYFNPKRVDVRLCILARAAAWHELVEADELELDEAFDQLVESVEISFASAAATEADAKAGAADYLRCAGV